MWFASGLRALPSETDVLEAWTFNRRGRLGGEASMAPSNVALFIGLLIGIAIDRLASAHLGISMSSSQIG